MIIGYFDYIIIGILIFLNIKFWKIQIDVKIGCLVGGISFGLILPFISMIIEIQRVNITIGIIDNFEILYTFLRFPTYWIIGIVQAIVTAIKLSLRKLNQQYNIPS